MLRFQVMLVHSRRDLKVNICYHDMQPRLVLLVPAKLLQSHLVYVLSLDKVVLDEVLVDLSTILAVTYVALSILNALLVSVFDPLLHGILLGLLFLILLVLLVLFRLLIIFGFSKVCNDRVFKAA